MVRKEGNPEEMAIAYLRNYIGICLEEMRSSRWSLGWRFHLPNADLDQSYCNCISNRPTLHAMWGGGGDLTGNQRRIKSSNWANILKTRHTRLKSTETIVTMQTRWYFNRREQAMQIVVNISFLLLKLKSSSSGVDHVHLRPDTDVALVCYKRSRTLGYLSCQSTPVKD